MHETPVLRGLKCRFSVRHVTAYYYKTPVAFGEHRMMLRPREARNHTRAQPTDLDAGHVWQSHGARAERGNTAARHLDWGTVGLSCHESNSQGRRAGGGFGKTSDDALQRMQWLNSGGW